MGGHDEIEKLALFDGRPGFRLLLSFSRL